MQRIFFLMQLMQQGSLAGKKAHPISECPEWILSSSFGLQLPATAHSEAPGMAQGSGFVGHIRDVDSLPGSWLQASTVRALVSI